MTREEKIDKIVHKCRRTSDCRECKLYGYYSVCPVDLYLKDGTPMADWSVNRAYEILLENEETRKEFTQADLETGMVVQLRNGKSLLVIKRESELRMFDEVQFLDGSNLTDNLKSRLLLAETRHPLDIMKVFAPADLKNVSNVIELIERKGELIWKRIEKMTYEEVKEIVGYDFEIVAPPVGQDS